MNDGEKYYLTEVLGLKSLVVSNSGFFVYSPFELAKEELTLVEKMLGAIGITGPRYISQSRQSPTAIDELAKEFSSSFGVSFGLNPPSGSSVKWLELPAVSQFIDDSDGARRDQAKRSAWEKLKKLKGEMSGS